MLDIVSCEVDKENSRIFEQKKINKTTHMNV